MPNPNPTLEGLTRYRAERPEYRKIRISLPTTLLERVDAERDRPRSQVIAEALRAWLERG